MKNKLTILKIIWIILLIICFFPIDYSYYQILRWYVFLLSGYLAYTYYKTKREYWIWIFWITALIFNPIATTNFWKEIWMTLDSILIFILIFNILKINILNILKIKKLKWCKIDIIWLFLGWPISVLECYIKINKKNKTFFKFIIFIWFFARIYFLIRLFN